MTRITLAHAVVGSIATLTALAGCLRRDVAAQDPTTKSSFATVVPQPAIDKVDLLLMVDNSSSMADKQRILADAVPDLLRGLVQPKCVDKTTRVATGKLADPLKAAAEQCAAGSEPAFTPITDMHIGIISSSLGGMGSNSCKATEAGRHNDDHGRLVARGKDGKDLAQAGDLHFLAWYPDVEQNADKSRHPDPPVPATKSLDTLGASFRELVTGIGQDGCGFEAQLESVYRFLVQPDPWTQIALVDGHATYGAPGEVDGDLLEQRAAFLRPDSLVAVVVLSDEDDSSVDPLAFQGTAWRFEQGNVVSKQCPDCMLLPRATAACAEHPNAKECTSCVFAATDPSCAANGGVYSPEQDPINVRFHAMKRRFGVDPQFPVTRYVDGFTKTKVPSRAAEHVNGTYVGRTDCTNPLFAARLPSQPNEELCRLPRGARTKDLVYFAVIGGVPNQLLPAGTKDPVDWTKILGKDPSTYDETGIDPHMIASTDPRPGLPPPTAADDADPISGREWTTGGTDLQFACTFPLFEVGPDGRSAPAAHPCLKDDSTCDCNGAHTPPLCAKSDARSQVRGKAYPARRELQVARDLGDHGIAASLCPKQLSAPDADDYGYRPAVRAITDRLEGSLVASCVPHPLTRDPGDGKVPCLVLATLATPGPDTICKSLGLETPGAEVLVAFRDRVAAEEGEGSRAFPVCEVPQTVVAPGASCRGEDANLGFCYAENIPGASCPRSLVFTKATAKLQDARFTLQCIQVGEQP